MKKIVLFIILFITMITTVSAKEIIISRDKIPDITTYYYDVNQDRYRYLFTRHFMFEDTTAYCLELGVEIMNENYTPLESFDATNLSSDIIEKIKMIAYYGYDYPGHNTTDFYLATQALIWEEISHPNITYIIGTTPSRIYDVSKEKNEILNLIDTHYQKPSFDNSEIYYTLGDQLELEDTNNVIGRYKADIEGVLIEGNKLIITKDFKGGDITLKKINYTGKSYLLYTAENSQKMMSTGVMDDVESSVKIKTVGGTLELIKLDKDTKNNVPQGEATLDGAVYEVYDINNTLIDTIITGTKNKIENLSIGKYTIKEKTPSKGYTLDKNIYEIVVTPEKLDIVLEVYEEVIKRKIEVFKVFASDTTGELKGEPNITFEIYDKDNKLVNKITTDNEGYAYITLPYGKYKFKQINATENYHKLKDFTITISEANEKPIHKLLSNSEIKAKLKIIKKDLDTKENIFDSNIKFKIFDVTNNKYLSLKVSYPENKITEEFMIDKNGIFITPIALSPGKYIIEEVKESLDGYTYNNDKITLEIGENTNLIKEDGELLVEVLFYNKRVKGTIEVTKYGEEITYQNNSFSYKEIPLEDVVLGLYAKEDIYENRVLIYKKNDLIKELTTNKEGKAQIDNIPLGLYYIKELSTIKGHILEEKIYDINIEYIDENTEVINKSIVIKNKLPKGNLIINKYETGTNIAVPNTLIELHTKNNKVVYKGYTDSNGQILIKELPYGEYYLSETEASTGYRLLEDKVLVEINKEEEIVNIYNERIEVPSTSSFNALDIYVLVIFLIAVLLIIFFHSEKKVVLISIIIIVLALTYLILKLYNTYSDNKNNENGVSAYINSDSQKVEEPKYQYSSVIEIPSINLKRGITDINSEYNDAKYNIELIKEEENTIVLAAHNGNNQNSYFKDLKKLTLGDQILYYKDGVLYTYIYSENYDIKKDGYADIYRKEDEKSIILITCKDNTDDGQTVHIGYLLHESTY